MVATIDFLPFMITICVADKLPRLYDCQDMQHLMGDNDTTSSVQSLYVMLYCETEAADRGLPSQCPPPARPQQHWWKLAPQHQRQQPELMQSLPLPLLRHVALFVLASPQLLHAWQRQLKQVSVGLQVHGQSSTHCRSCLTEVAEAAKDSQCRGPFIPTSICNEPSI